MASITTINDGLWPPATLALRVIDGRAAMLTPVLSKGGMSERPFGPEEIRLRRISEGMFSVGEVPFFELLIR